MNIAGWGGGSGNNFNAIMHHICGPGGAQFQGPVATQPTGQGVDEAVQSPAKPGGGGQAEAVCQRGHLVCPPPAGPANTAQHAAALKRMATPLQTTLAGCRMTNWPSQGLTQRAEMLACPNPK